MAVELQDTNTPTVITWNLLDSESIVRILGWSQWGTWFLIWEVSLGHLQLWSYMCVCVCVCVLGGVQMDLYHYIYIGFERQGCIPCRPTFNAHKLYIHMSYGIMILWQMYFVTKCINLGCMTLVKKFCYTHTKLTLN